MPAAACEYVIHDYLEHQRSAAKIAEISEKRAENGRRGGSRSRPRTKQTGSNLLHGGFGSAEAKPTPDTEEVLRTSQTDTEIPPSAALDASGDTAQTLIGEWIDHCRKRPPDRVIGQVGKELRALLAEGVDPADVRRGLAAWARKGLHPSTLASAVNEVMNAASANGAVAIDRRQQAVNEKFESAYQRAEAKERGTT